VQHNYWAALATLQFFRLIWATKAHPRTAILVQTVIVGLIDLMHFFILFVILLGGYMALGHAQFGWYRTEFKVRAFSILVSFHVDKIVWSIFVEIPLAHFVNFTSKHLADCHVV
jgi:hypothetical protein